MIVQKLQRLARGLVWQLPQRPYPSNHPWSIHHEPSRPRG